MINYHTLNLKPGDRIIIPKSGADLIQHHAIYAGNGFFYENKVGKGVVLTHHSALFQDVTKVSAVQRFQGNEWERQAALQRAESLVGKPYNGIFFNCEHYASEVQDGVPRSKQVENVAGGLALLLLIFAVSDMA